MKPKAVLIGRIVIEKDVEKLLPSIEIIEQTLHIELLFGMNVQLKKNVAIIPISKVNTTDLLNKSIIAGMITQLTDLRCTCNYDLTLYQLDNGTNFVPSTQQGRILTTKREPEGGLSHTKAGKRAHGSRFFPKEGSPRKATEGENR